MLDIAQARKRHVVTDNEKPLISRHGVQSFSRRIPFFLVIEMRVPVWMLDGHDIVQAFVRPGQQALPFALDLERHQPWRMPRRIDGRDSRHDLLARFLRIWPDLPVLRMCARTGRGF